MNTTTGPQYRATKAENLIEPNRWLDRAVKLEADGKSSAMIEMAFKRALDFENYAFTLE